MDPSHHDLSAARLEPAFDHSDFERSVRHVVRLRRFAHAHRGPSKEEFYQTLVDSFAEQQQQQLEDSGDIKDNHSHSQSSVAKPTAAEARTRIREHFGDDFAEAGRALLLGDRYNSNSNNNSNGTTTSFADCGVTTVGSRATLWARTVKDWRRNRAIERQREMDMQQQRDEDEAELQKIAGTRRNVIAQDAMAAVNAQFHNDTLVDRWRQRENDVQQRTSDAINSRLSQRSRGVSARVQAVIERARRLERRNSSSEQDELEAQHRRWREEQERKHQEALAKELDPAKRALLHGMWLRNLLPGQSRLFLNHSRVDTTHSSSTSVLGEEEEDEDGSVSGGAFGLPDPSLSATLKSEHSQPHHRHHHLLSSKHDSSLLDPERIRERANRILFGHNASEPQPTQSSFAPANATKSRRGSNFAGPLEEETAAATAAALSRRGSHAGGSPASRFGSGRFNNSNVNFLDDDHDGFVSPVPFMDQGRRRSSAAYSVASSTFSQQAQTQKQQQSRNPFYDQQQEEENERNRHRVTARDAHSQVILLLNAEMYGNEAEDDEKYSNGRKAFSHKDEADAKNQWRLANAHYGDSRHAHVWDFEVMSPARRRELESRKNSVASSSSPSSTAEELTPDKVEQQQHQQHSNSEFGDSSSSTSDSIRRQHIAKSERLMKIHKQLQILESGPIHVVRKEKFQCRRERRGNTNNNGGLASAAGGTNSFNNASGFGESAFDTGGNNNNNNPSAADTATSTSTKNQQQRIPVLCLGAGKYVALLDIKLNHLDPQTGNPVALRATNIPEPDLFAYQRYAREKNMVIIIRPVSAVVPMLYATEGLHIKGKSINVSLKSSSYRPIDGLIPVNPALGKAYLDAMRREREIEDQILNATGGVVTISLLKRLKALKAAAGSLTQAFRRDITNSLERSERELASILDEYREKLVVTVDKESISRQYIERFNEAQFLGTTHAKWKGHGIFFREVTNVVERDGKEVKEVGVERDPKEAPIFYIWYDASQSFHCYLPDLDATVDEPAINTEQLHPVMVVTHRMFTVSETTKRIEPDPTLYMIGPDFDGMCYARRVASSSLPADRCQWAEIINTYTLQRSMGLVNKFDEEHVKEVRLLTDWKQNHGYECGNTVKTQPVTHGPHVVITPSSFSVLYTVHEIIGYIRTAWLHNIPLLLNPNWRVVLDKQTMLPWLYGEYLETPVIDDCGASAAQTRCEIEDPTGALTGGGFDHIKHSVTPMEQRVEELKEEMLRTSKLRGVAAGINRLAGGGGNAGGASTSNTEDTEGSLEEAVRLVVDKKRVAESFFAVRRWMLMPPVMIETATTTLSATEAANGVDDSPLMPVTVSRESSGFDSQQPKDADTKHDGNDEQAAGEELPTATPAMTQWDAQFIQPGVCPEFETYRRRRVADLLEDFAKCKEMFLFLHKSCSSFITHLEDYLFPEARCT